MKLKLLLTMILGILVLATTSFATQPNVPPIAHSIDVYTDEDTFVQSSFYCEDYEGDQLTYSIVNYPTFVDIVYLSNNVFHIMPEENYWGITDFYYHCFDGEDFSNIGRVSVHVASVNDAPVANDISRFAFGPTNIYFDCDDDAPTHVLTYNVVTNPQHGTVLFVNGQHVYFPDYDYVGSDSLTYTCNDGELDSMEGLVNITVNFPNVPPRAHTTEIVTNEDTSVTSSFWVEDVVPHEFYDGVQTYSFAITEAPQHGEITNLDGGVYTYMPDPNYYGSDIFRYSFSDGFDTTQGSVWVEVLPVRDPIKKVIYDPTMD